MNVRFCVQNMRSTVFSIIATKTNSFHNFLEVLRYLREAQPSLAFRIFRNLREIMGCIRIMGPEDTLFPAQLKGVHFHEYYISQQSSSISSYFVSKPSILTLNVRSPNP